MANTIKTMWGTAAGKAALLGSAVVVGTVTVYEFSGRDKPGDASQGQYVKQDIAKTDAQGDVRLKLEGLKDAPTDTDAAKAAAKAAAEAAAKAAEEAAKQKEAEAKKLEETLKTRKEADKAEEAAAEQQAQGEDGVAADEGQQNDDFKDGNVDADNGESEAELGPDTYKGGNEDNDEKVDGKKDLDDLDDNDPNNAETRLGTGVNDNENNENNNDNNNDNIDENETGKKNENDNIDGNEIGKDENKDEIEKDENENEKEIDENGNLIEKKENEEVVEEENKEENEEINKITEDQQDETETGNNETNNETNNENNENETNNENNEKNENENKNEIGKNENKTEKNEEQVQEQKRENIVEKGESDNAKNVKPDGKNDSKNNATPAVPPAPVPAGDSNSTFKHNNYGLNMSGGWSDEDTMQDARRRWMKNFEGASNGVVVVSLKELGLLGAVPVSGWTKIATGVDWVVSQAASYEKSTVRKLVFEGAAGDRSEVCKGIGSGINMIGSGDAPLRSGEQVFCIDVGFTLTDSDIETLKNSASMDENNAASYWQDIKVSFDNGVVYVYRKSDQLSPKDEQDAARKRLLEIFRKNEIAHVCQNDYESTGIAWAVQAAMTDSQSIVKELVFDEIKSAGEDFDQIGVGIGEALKKGWPSHDKVFSIRVGFDVNDHDHLDGLKKSARSRDGIEKIALGTRRIFVYGAGEGDICLNMSLRNRFKNPGDSYVYEFELDLYDCIRRDYPGQRQSLEGVLLRAATEGSKVKTLYLRTDSGDGAFFVKDGNDFKEGVIEALVEICALEEVDLKIAMNLDEKEANDLQIKVNNSDYAKKRGRRKWQVYVQNGFVSFKRVPKLVEVRDNFNASDNMDMLEKYFREHSGTISWDDLVADDDWNAKKFHEATVSSYRKDFRDAAKELKADVIPVAAKLGSQCTELSLGEALFGWVALSLKNVLKQPGAIHGFDLRVDNAQKIYDSVIKHQTSEWKHKLEINNGVLRIVNGVDVPGSGTETTPPSTDGADKNTEVPADTTVTADTTITGIPGAGAGAERKVDIAQAVRDLEAKLKNAPAEVKFVFEPFLGSDYTMPCIYAYGYVNWCLNHDEEGNVAPKGGFGAMPKNDVTIVTDVLDPKDHGLSGNDLVLEATCFYKKGMFADGDENTIGTKNTRNYFAHPWLHEVLHHKGGNLYDKIKVTVSEADGIKTLPNKGGEDTFGKEWSITTHDAIDLPGSKTGGIAFLSGQDFIFQIDRSGAHAWFKTEHTHLNIGKRTILIHWTFVEDEDGKEQAKVEKESIKLPFVLPCQFSPNPDERSMEAVNAYLKWKKEKKAEEEELRVKREEWLKKDICTIDRGVFADEIEFGNFLTKVIDNKHVEKLIVTDNSGFVKDALKAFLEKIIEGTYGDDIKLRELECSDRSILSYLWKQVDKKLKKMNDKGVVYEVRLNSKEQTLTFKKWEEKEDEETRARRLLFKLKQTLKGVTRGSTIAANDMAPYLKTLGLQKVLETVFNVDYSNDVNVQILFDPYLKDRKDEWVEIFRKICSGSSALGTNKVHIVGGDKEDVYSLGCSIVGSVNACASVQCFLCGQKEDLSLYSIGNDPGEQGKRKGRADQIAAKFKDYSDQLPLAILTALGEFGNYKMEDLSADVIDEKVKGLRKKLADRSEEEDAKFESFIEHTAMSAPFDEYFLPFVANTLGLNIVIWEIEKKEGEGDKFRELRFHPTWSTHMSNDVIRPVTMEKAKGVFPKSLAKRMLWIKKTIERKDGATDKVIYAVDFDAAEGFNEDVSLAFEGAEQLNVTRTTLEYLRYSLDPKAFLKAFFEVPLAGRRVVSLSREAATPAFFDALQAMCDEERDSGYLIFIGALPDEDATEKSVRDRFDPLAKTYVVFEKNKKTFRYANGDELERFKKFKEDNPLDENSDFKAIEKAKSEWFKSELQRVRQEAEEAEQKAKEEKERKEEEDRQALVDAFTNAFNRGGAIKVDQAMIDALGKKRVISSRRGTPYSVLNVIRKAAEPGSRITQLEVEFDTTDQFEKALGILVRACKKSGRALKLRVNHIGDADSQCLMGGKYQSYLAQSLAVGGKREHEDCTEYIVRTQYDLGNGNYVTSTDQNIIWVSKVGVSNEYDKGKALADGKLKDVLDNGGNLEDAFANAGGEAKSLDANGVDVDELGETLEGWFSEVAHRNNGQHWFLTLDKDNDEIWRQMEKIARVINEINLRFVDETNKIFMYVDRAGEKIFFNKKWSGLAQEGGTLVWDWYALSFLPRADIKHCLMLPNFKDGRIEKFGEFAEAVAENTSIKSIKFNVDATEYDDDDRKVIIAVIGKEEFWKALKEKLDSHGEFKFICPWGNGSWKGWDDASLSYGAVKEIIGDLRWEIKAFDVDGNEMADISEDNEGSISRVEVTVPKKPVPEGGDDAEDGERREEGKEEEAGAHEEDPFGA